jgi:hypothetical protein
MRFAQIDDELTEALERWEAAGLALMPACQGTAALSPYAAGSARTPAPGNAGSFGSPSRLEQLRAERSRAARSAASAFQKRASCEVAKLIRIRLVGRGGRGTGCPGASSQSSIIACASALAVDAGVDPAEQAARLGGEAAAVRLGEAHRARPCGVEPLHDPLGMAAERPCSRQCASASSPAPGVVSVESSLVSTKRSTSDGGAAR